MPHKVFEGSDFDGSPDLKSLKSKVTSPHLKSKLPLTSKPTLQVSTPKLKLKAAAIAAKTDQEFLDMSQALVPQMFSKHFSKQFYLQEVHKPRFLRGSAKFFNQPYLEILTRTPWYVIPLVWGPIIAWHLWTAVQDFSDSPTSSLLGFTLVFIGMFTWTLLEYVFHRFLFHMDKLLPANQIAFSIHFLLHGVHHFLPMDRLRLVMPPVMFAGLSIGPYSLFKNLMGQKVLNPLYSGIVISYIAYDMFHYFSHHGVSKLNIVNRMKTYHMAHHYKDYNKGYGVTSILWDLCFSTTLDHSKFQMSNNSKH